MPLRKCAKCLLVKDRREFNVQEWTCDDCDRKMSGGKSQQATTLFGSGGVQVVVGDAFPTPPVRLSKKRQRELAEAAAREAGKEGAAGSSASIAHKPASGSSRPAASSGSARADEHPSKSFKPDTELKFERKAAAPIEVVDVEPRRSAEEEERLRQRRQRFGAN